MMQDIRAEMHFYGAKLDTMGMVYIATRQIPLDHPGVLLFCLYTLAVLTHKKLTLPTVKRMQEKLSAGARWQSVFEEEEDRPFDPMMKLGSYTYMTKRVIRTQLLFRKEGKFSFMMGSSGFGLFTNRRNFEHCAEGSVYGLMEHLYRIHQEEQPETIEMLWQAATALGQVDFSHPPQGSRNELAKQIFDSVAQ